MRTGKMRKRLSQQSNEDRLRKQTTMTTTTMTTTTMTTTTMTATTMTMTTTNEERITRDKKVDKDKNRTDGGRTNTTIKLRQHQG